MTRIWFRTVLLTVFGGLLVVCLFDNSADACHRRHRRRCDGNGCYGGGCYGGGAYYGGATYGGGAYYGGGYGAPVAPYGQRVYGGAAYGQSARGTIEGGARVDGSVRSPSDRARTAAGADVEGRATTDEGAGRGRAELRGESDVPPPPQGAEDRPSNLPPPRGDRSPEGAPPPAPGSDSP